MGAVSEQKAPPPRPPQVTVACVVVLLGSVFAVLLMWDRIAGLHAMATRQALQSFLSRSKLHDDGVGVAGLTTTVKVLSMVCAACAVATGVQAWHASRRSRSARVALSILAVPLFVTGLVSDGIVGSAAATFWCTAVAAAVMTMWLGPNRIWFGDAPPAPRPAGPPPPHLRTWDQPDLRVPPPSVPFGSPPQAGPTQTAEAPPTSSQTSYGPPPGWSPPSTSMYDVRRPAGARPRALLWACALTWVCTGIAATGLVLSLVVLSHNSQPMLDDLYRKNPQFAEQGLSRHAVLTMLISLSAVVLVAALAAAAFAVLVFLRRRWAWYALVVCASGATMLFVIGSFGSRVAIVMLGACVATIACLVRPEVRAWLLRR
jgi:hypothetical protein